MANQFSGLFNKGGSAQNIDSSGQQPRINQFSDLFNDDKKKKDEEERKRQEAERLKMQKEQQQSQQTKPAEQSQNNKPQQSQETVNAPQQSNSQQENNQGYQPQGWFEEKIKQYFPVAFDSIVKLGDAAKQKTAEFESKYPTLEQRSEALSEAVGGFVQEKIIQPTENLYDKEGAAGILKAVGKGLYTIPKYAARASLSIALSTPLGENLQGELDPKEFGVEGLLGDEKITAAIKKSQEVEKKVADAGGSKIEQLMYPALFVGGGLYADLSIGSLGKNTIGEIIAITEKNGAETFLKRVGVEATEENIQKVITAKTDKEAVETLKDLGSKQIFNDSKIKSDLEKGTQGTAVPAQPVDSSIRDTFQSLQEKSKNIDHYSDEGDAMMTKLTETKDELDNLIAQSKEIVVNVPKEDGTPLFNIEVVKYSDGKWGRSFNADLEHASFDAPFNAQEIFASKEAAIKKTGEDVKIWVESEVKSAGGIKSPELEQISKEAANLEAGKVPEAVAQVDNIAKDAQGGIEPLADAPTIKKPLIQDAVWKNEDVEFNPSEYVKDMIGAREAARKLEGSGILQKSKTFLKEVKSKLVDFSAPIEDTLREAQKMGKFSVLPKADITNQIDRVLRTPTLAGQFARDNGLEKIVKEVDNIDHLDQYMIAKHALDVEAQGIKTGRDLVKDKKLVDVLASKYEETAKQVRDYSHKLLDYSVESGLISDDLAKKLKEIYPNYVPLNRVFNELEKGGTHFGSKGVASISKQSVVQRLAGSERAIESPLESLLAKTNDAFTQGEKNKAAKILTGYKELTGNPFRLRELKKGETAPHSISFLDNGVKKTFETTKEISEAAKALNVQQINILGQIFAAPVRLARIGITGINLPFVASNVVKDQISAVINSKRALKTSIANPVNFVRALFSAVKHDKLYQEMVRNGAAGTSFDISRNQVSQTVARIRSEKNVVSKIAYTVKHPSELLRTVEDIIGRSEELTRIQQYRGTKEALLKEGRTEADAAIEASRAARENTVNFSRRGEWGTVLNSTFLYLNASIQGSRTFVRNMSQRPIATGVKLALTVFTPVAIVTAWNLNDPKRKEAYQDIGEFEKENNIIIIPPNPTKDKEGKWNVIKIPLSQEINNVANIPRKIMEQAHGLDPVKFGDVAKGLIGSVSPIAPDKKSAMSTLTPQAIKPTIEWYTNTTLFTGFKQVPQSMENLSPKLQAKDYTSGTARLIGGKFNLSPIKIEAFIKGTVGGVGMQAINITDRALAGLDLIPKDQIGGQNVVEAITARFNKASGGSADEKTNEELKKALTKQADESFRLRQEAEVLNEALKTLPGNEANAKVTELKKANPQLFDKLKGVVEDDKLGLDYGERLIKQLGVENGERAKFIQTVIKTKGTNEEKNAYIADLKKKKIISDAVFAQLKKIKENE